MKRKDQQVVEVKNGERVLTGLSFFCGLAVSLLFIFSGAVKIFNPPVFAFAAFRYHLIPYPLVNAVSLWMAWLELVCGLGVLVFPRYRKPALAILLLLLLAFTGGIAFNLLRGVQSACGCFSASEMADPMTWRKVVENAGLMILAGIALLRHPAETRRTASTGTQKVDKI
jgi:hypothetical protein